MRAGFDTRSPVALEGFSSRPALRNLPAGVEGVANDTYHKDQAIVVRHHIDEMLIALIVFELHH